MLGALVCLLAIVVFACATAALGMIDLAFKIVGLIAAVMGLVMLFFCMLAFALGLSKSEKEFNKEDNNDDTKSSK